MRRPYWIPYHSPPHDFPPVEHALIHPDGLLAVGGDLTPTRLMIAYRRGIFPWYSEEQPILWWSPSQRMVLFPEHLKIARSLRKVIKKQRFHLTFDQNFRGVITACAQQPRPGQLGTWITDDMIEAYCQLHDYNFAHSVESWYEGQLVGGIYGIVLGKVFFGESMFSHVNDASKVAFVHFVHQLQRWGYELIDCQAHTDHLQHFGAFNIPREQYLRLLDHLCAAPGHTGEWRFDDAIAEND